MQVLRGLAKARNVYWRSLGRELLGDELPGIEKFRIETVELTPDRKLTTTAAYYFDVSGLPNRVWKPIKGSELHAPLNVRFPCELGWLHTRCVTDHEMAVPGSGISVGYGAPGIKATFYVYDWGRDIPDNIMHPRACSPNSNR